MCVVLLSHSNVTMPKQLPPPYVLIRKLLSRLDKEAKLNKPLISFTRPNQRASNYLGLPLQYIDSVRRFRESEGSHGRPKKAKISTVPDEVPPPMKSRSKVDSFDKSVIKNATLTLITRNENIDLKKLKTFLKNEKNMDISTYSLWKTLHSLGFRYGKVKRNQMGLLERPDIVRRRIGYLRDIKSHREAGHSIVYLDETWVDSNCYPGYQWSSPEGNNLLLEFFGGNFISI